MAVGLALAPGEPFAYMMIARFLEWEGKPELAAHVTRQYERANRRLGIDRFLRRHRGSAASPDVGADEPSPPL